VQPRLWRPTCILMNITWSSRPYPWSRSVNWCLAEDYLAEISTKVRKVSCSGSEECWRWCATPSSINQFFILFTSLLFCFTTVQYNADNASGARYVVICTACVSFLWNCSLTWYQCHWAVLRTWRGWWQPSRRERSACGRLCRCTAPRTPSWWYADHWPPLTRYWPSAITSRTTSSLPMTTNSNISISPGLYAQRCHPQDFTTPEC